MQFREGISQVHVRRCLIVDDGGYRIDPDTVLHVPEKWLEVIIWLVNNWGNTMVFYSQLDNDVESHVLADMHSAYKTFNHE